MKKKDNKKKNTLPQKKAEADQEEKDYEHLAV